MKVRLLLASLLVVLALILLLSAACSPKTAAPAAKYGSITSLRISGASIGSQTYLLGSMFASHWTADLSLPSTALIMSEVEALKKFPTKEVEVSYAQVPTGYTAYNGEGDWQGKAVKNVRTMINMTPFQPYYFAVKGDSSIKKIPDLINKRIARAEVGMAAEVYPRIIMEYGYDMTEEKIKSSGGVVLHMSYDDMLDKLADGSVDVISMPVTWNVRSPYVLPVEQKTGVRLLPVEPDASQKILAKMPYLIYDKIAGGLYKLEPNPIPAMGVVATYVVRQDLPDNLVYDMLDSLVKHKTDFQKNLVNFPDFGNLDVVLRGLKEIGIPMHPGAAKWYREHNVNIPAEIKVEP